MITYLEMQVFFKKKMRGAIGKGECIKKRNQFVRHAVKEQCEK
jgi:hypothetical protein